MAKPGSSSPLQRSSPVSLFIDTNLDTHLVMAVSPRETVADLKGKINIEHTLCFPNVGKVSVQSLKVKRRSSFYHLSDSMLVEDAFSGIKGTWFLYLDLVPAKSIMERQTETAGVITSTSHAQPQKNNLLKSDHNASRLPVSGEDLNQDFVMNGLSTEEGLLQTSISNVYENQTLPYTRLQHMSAEGDSLSANVNSPQAQNLGASSDDMLDSELDRRPGAGVSEMELVTEGDAVVGSHHHQKSGQATDKGNKDRKGEVQGNVDAGADVDVPIFARLQHISAEGDPLSANVNSPQAQNLGAFSDDMLDSELDRRPGAGVSEMELVTEGDAVVGSHHHQKSGQGTDKGNKDRKGGDQGNVDAGADVDVPIFAGRKEKSRKRSISLQNQFPDGKSEHPYVEKKKHKKEKDRPLEEPAKDQLAGHNPENVVYRKEISQSEKVLRQQSFQEKHESNLASSEGLPSKPSHFDSSLQQTPIDVNKRKAKGKHLLENDEIPQDELVDNSLCKDDATLRKQAAEENHIEGLVNNHYNLGKESDEADSTEVSTQKVLDGSSADVGMTDPSSTYLKLSNYSTARLLEGTTSTDFSIPEVSIDNPERPLPRSTEALNKESNAADICKEAEQPSNHAKIDSEVPENSHHSRKKSKIGKDASNKHDTLDASVKPINEDSVKEASQNNHDKPSKTDGGSVTDTYMDNTVTTKFGIVSDISLKSLQHGRKKKLRNTELPKTLSDTHETVKSPRDQIPEENQSKTSSTHQEKPGNEFKLTAVSGNAVAAGNSAPTNSTFPSNPCDQKQKNGKKKSGKIELHQESNLKSSTLKTGNSSRDIVIEEFSKEKSTGHLEHQGRESEEVAILGENAENSLAVQSVAPSDPNDKKSKRSRKRSEKIKLPSGQSIRADSVHFLGDEITKQNIKESIESDQKEASGNRHPSKESEGVAVFEEAAVVVTTATVDSTVPLNPSDKKSKRRHKKSEKIELPSGQASRAESVHSLVDEVTKQTLKEPTEGNRNEASVSHLGHPSKDSEGASLFKEAAVVANTATADSTVPLNPSDKHKRKKSGKSELRRKESSKDEAVHSLVKKAKKNVVERLNGSVAGTREDSMSEMILREAAGLENAAELDSVTTSTSDGRNSCHQGKKNARTGLINHASSNYDLDHSLVSEHTRVNLEKGSGTSGKSSDSEFNAGINSDETGQNMHNAKPSNLDSRGFHDSSDKHETGHLNTMGLEKSHKESFMETVRDTAHEGSTKEVQSHRGLPKADGKFDLFNILDPKDNQLEPVQELPFLETETKKTNKEKSKRKKKLNPSPKNSSLLNSVSDEHILKKKPQDYDSGKNSLTDTSIQIAKEFKSRKKHEKKIADRTHKSDVHLRTTSSDLGSPGRSRDSDRPGNMIQDYESNKHLQGAMTLWFLSLSVDEESKHPNGKSSTSAGSKLQSLTKEFKSRKKHEKKIADKTHKSDVHLRTTSSDLGSPGRSRDSDRPGNMIQDYESNKHLQGAMTLWFLSLSVDEESKHPNGKSSTSAGSKLQSLTIVEGNDIMVSAREVPKHKDFDATVSSCPGAAPVTQNSSNAGTNVSVQENMADLIASTDSTKEDNPSLRKRSKVAVRKVPQSRHGKVLNKFNEEKTSLFPSATISNDATSGSSDAEFKLRNKQSPVTATSDISSPPAYSDGDLGINKSIL